MLSEAISRPIDLSMEGYVGRIDKFAEIFSQSRATSDQEMQHFPFGQSNNQYFQSIHNIR